MQVLIVENSNSSLIRESLPGKKDYILSGPFTDFDVKNRNERVYTAEKFLPALNELNTRILELGVVYGEFDHPDVFDHSLARSSHIITKAKYVKEQNRVLGEIKLISTYWGKEAKSLVDDGLPLFVSSRAAGITESDGSVSLKKLFTYDIVADPGFASAKMSNKILNESLGFQTTKSNFRIYELSDESKTNELFNMNKNDFVTKKQLTDYSHYLVNELATTKKTVNEAISKGNMTPKKLDQLLEYYEDLNSTNSKVVKYLDYLAEKIQIVVNENTSLRSTTQKLIKHNDYLAENLEKAINYSEYLSENLDKNIAYSEYLAENLDKNIAYSEYIAENLDKNISYSEYIAEHLDNSIVYSEYLAEHLEGNIAYSEYIAEHLDDNIAYSEYIAEGLDKSISYQGMIVEKLNSGKLFESFDNNDRLPSLDDAGFDMIDDEEETFADDYTPDYEEETFGEEEVVNQLPVEEYPEQDHDCEECGGDTTVEDEYEFDDEFGNEFDENEYEMNNDSELSESINKLIEEAKKRKVSETSDLNFLKFLNKSQVDSFYALTNEERETVKLHINERSYFSQKEVLSLIAESLSTKNESIEEKVIRLMPENIKPVWENLSDSSKKSVLSQAKLYPEDVMINENQIEHFWLTRKLKTKESTKKLVSHDSLIQEDRLSDSDANAILERFKNL